MVLMSKMHAKTGGGLLPAILKDSNCQRVGDCKFCILNSRKERGEAAGQAFK